MASHSFAYLVAAANKCWWNVWRNVGGECKTAVQWHKRGNCRVTFLKDVENQQKSEQGQTILTCRWNISLVTWSLEKSLLCVFWLAFSTGLHQNNWILRGDFVCRPDFRGRNRRLRRERRLSVTQWLVLQSDTLPQMLPACLWWNIELVFGETFPPSSAGVFLDYSLSFRLSGGLRNNTYGGDTPFSPLFPHPSPLPHFSSPSASSLSGPFQRIEVTLTICWN